MFRSAFLSLCIGAFLSGCYSDENLNKNTVIVALGSKPATLDPRFAKDASGMRIVSLLFNSLVKIGPDLKITGDAAESWTYKNLVYTFRLKRGLKFANGRRLTPEDIEFSFAEFQKPSNPFRSAFEKIKNVSACMVEDQILVKLYLKEFSANLLSSELPVVKILPKKEILEQGFAYGKKPFGTGSFHFQKKVVNNYHLKANESHPYAPPKVDKVVFKVVSNEFTLFQKMLKGEIDIAQGEIAPEKISYFEQRTKEFWTFKYPGLRFSYLLVNFKNPQLAQLKVRQAISQSIDRQKIIKNKFFGLASEATSLLTPENPFHLKELQNPKSDLTQTQTLINELGLKDKKITLKSASHRKTVDNAKVLAHEIGQSGLKIKVESFEWGTFFRDVQNGNFDLALMAWVGAIDPDIYRLAYHSKELPPGRNRGSYINGQLDELLDQGLRISNVAERVKHYFKVQKIVHRDLVVIPLWYDHQISVVNRRIKNYSPSLNGDFSPLIEVTKNMDPLQNAK